MATDYFTADISRHIWDTKYRLREGNVIHDKTVADTWRRVARALAEPEDKDRDLWEERFFGALEDFKFLPGGRIQAGAGVQRRVTLFNCFVMGRIDDSIDGIFGALKEGALTMQQGGGVGYDFSTLRPKGTPAQSVGSIASGPVSFMNIWDSMCATLLSTGARRGAMMATLRCEHPDIEEFITVKRDKDRLRHFNLSVLVSDAFMDAVREDREWPLVFPLAGLDDDALAGDSIMCQWSAQDGATACRVFRRVRARELWERIMRATYDYAEPGVLFIDRINQMNNLWYREQISATNPCGEIPLPAYGACDLGSINLTRFVEHPFSDQARFDSDGIRETVQLATRMMDNVIDISRFPLSQQAEQARGSRRIGLGITGLGDSLIMLGHGYGGKESLALAGDIMRLVCHTAYMTSIELAREKGCFPFFDKDKYLQGQFISALPVEIRDAIARHGIRNSHLTAIAPTGTISLLANNVSSGLEPVFDFSYRRQVLEADGSRREYALNDYACQLWRQLHGDTAPLPAQFLDTRSLRPENHLDMQAAIQPFVDNAISKTINIPEDYDFESFQHLYALAYSKGLKGCTTFRPNPVTGEVLTPRDKQAHHCCSLEREAD